MISVIGNVPVDLLAHVSDDFLAEHGLTKGVNTTISHDQQNRLLKATQYSVIPGGCGANVAACMGLLKLPVQMIGSFGDDEYGAFALQALKDSGVHCYETPQKASTQIVFIFLTPDGDRSFAAFYDDETDVPVSELEAFLTTRPDGPVLLDGYKLLYPRYCDSIVNYVTGSLHDTVPFVMCPNDVGVIKAVPEAVKALYKRSTHVVMNQMESDQLFSDHNLVNPLKNIQNNGKSGAITNGSRGAELFTPDRVIQVPSALDAALFIDSNGAGDAFTAGYMYGVVHGLDLEEQGKIASLCAAEVLAVDGARPGVELYPRVFKEPL